MNRTERSSPAIHDNNAADEMDFGDLRNYMDQDISARQLPTTDSRPMAQFFMDMPDSMNVTMTLTRHWSQFGEPAKSFARTNSTKNIT